jgi:glycyl-tRNA synthetase beta chain
VVSAIEQHYWPRFAGDNLPETGEASAVALADRLDTMVGIFGIGQIPTGSKDPFALRRAAVGIIRILIERDVRQGLGALCDQAAKGFETGVLAADVSTTVADYIIERLRAWYEDQGISVGVLRAVIATGIDVPAEIDQRVKALANFAPTESAVALAAANKRVANILAKSEAPLAGSVDETLLTEAAEQTLYTALQKTSAELTPLQHNADFSGALQVLATLHESVDTFFEQVMVNADDDALRRNRYLLLKELRQQFVSVADIAQL